MTARSSRRMLLFGGLSCSGLFVLWLFVPLLGDAAPGFAKWGMLGTPLAFFRVDGPMTIVASAALVLGIMLLTQWLFLRPIRYTALHGAAAGRPRWHAVVAVAFVTTLLCTAVLATILEMPDWWLPVFGATDGPPWIIWIAMVVMWLGWALAFLVYFREGDLLARAEIVVRSLIRGSCLELLIAIPTHALVYRRGTDECYCVRGSYTGIALGSVVLLWAFGPGLVLLFLREKQRREPILQKLCPQCGATLDPAAPSGVPCPQCGRALVR